MNVTLSNLMSFVVLNLLSLLMQNWLVYNFLAQNGVEVRPELPKLTKMVRAKAFHACKKDNAAAICACVKTLWVVCPKSCAMKSGASSTPSGSAIVW